MPLPLNQKTNRLSIAFDAPSAAYAVPVELNMLTSGGSPICTALPASVSPLRKRLRETRERLTITCDTALPSLPDFNFQPIPAAPKSQISIHSTAVCPAASGTGLPTSLRLPVL